MSERATHGGPGWQPRALSHLDEVKEGKTWRRCGYLNEYAALRDVMVAWPGEELEFDDPPDRYLMIDHVDLSAIRRETESLIRFFEDRGVTVHVARPPTPPPPNFIFMRDLAFLTPEGAVVARMATEQRRGEERFAALALASIGVPIVATMRGRATFEGADALWLDRGVVLVGTGRRTNAEAVDTLRPLLASMGCETVAVDVPPGGTQHILGVVKFVDRDLAVLWRDRAADRLRETLASHGIRTVDLVTDDELTKRASLNFVTVAPREIVMPAHCPRTKALYEAAGIRCHELDIPQYLRAAGGLGCVVSIISRDT